MFNHAEFSGYNGTLNFNGYPTTNGVISGPPPRSPRTPSAATRPVALNVTGFGTVTQVGPGALGYSRVLQTLIRIQF